MILSCVNRLTFWFLIFDMVIIISQETFVLFPNILYDSLGLCWTWSCDHTHSDVTELAKLVYIWKEYKFLKR